MHTNYYCPRYIVIARSDANQLAFHIFNFICNNSYSNSMQNLTGIKTLGQIYYPPSFTDT